MEFTVLLDTDTVGTLICESVTIGERATVRLHNENGIPIEQTGTVIEILEQFPRD
jgi:hypothetical protein